MQYLFSDRFGGFSQGVYNSLNLALHVEDDFEKIALNRDVLREKIGTKNLIFMEQVHKDRIEIITEKNSTQTPKCDAMITNQKDLALCVMVADCIPVLFYDSAKEVIAVAHAGRNGVYLKIANKTVKLMATEFNCEIKNIKIFIGPSIKSCCYEVGQDVVKGFEDYLYVKDDKLYLDIVQKCVDDLQNLGINSKNIDISDVCTCCNQDYFSYRRDGVTGRFCGAIRL